LRRKLSLLVHARPPDESPAYDAVKRHPRVRRDGMSPAQARGLDGKTSLAIEHDDVGVAAARDPSLAREAREPGGSLGAPAGEVSQVPAAVARSGPGGGEPYPDRRDPTPRPHEVARVEALEDGGRGRMVARHEVEGPFGEALPQALPVAPLADRWGAFPGGGAVQDLLRGEGEIVRARLGGDPGTRAPGHSQPGARGGRPDGAQVGAASGVR